MLQPLDASAEAVRRPVSRRVQVFYYPWYGNPASDGRWVHWEQGGRRPPADAASAFTPTLGLYSSRDRSTLDQHMRWLADAGIGVVVTSWWGRGSAEDQAVPALLDSAAAYGVQVAFHIEPYPGRTAASVGADVAYLLDRYGQHPAFFRTDATAPTRSGAGVFYIYDSLSIASSAWQSVLDGLHRNRADAVLLSQTSDASHIDNAHFDGLYTYDVLRLDGSFFRPLADDLARRGALFAPSIGPGYDDTQAIPGSQNIETRDDGATYDRMWEQALASGAPWITITSFNEWHEGTQIEPARATARAGYEGAFGERGPASEQAYLQRTRYMVDRLLSSSGVTLVPWTFLISPG